MAHRLLDSGSLQKFVYHVVDDGDHISAAEELARQILENPQTPVREFVRVRRTMIVQDTARYWEITGDFDSYGTQQYLLRNSEIGGANGHEGRVRGDRDGRHRK